MREALDLIERLPGTLIRVNVVEFNPNRDLNDMTAVVAAKLIKQLVGRTALDRGVSRAA